MKRFPNALVIMVGFIFFSAIMTYVIPQGEYERTIDPQTNQTKVIPGSYKTVEAEPVSFFDTFVAIPEGIVERASLIALILLIGGCFVVIEKTGALKEGVEFLSGLVKGREALALLVVALAFLTGGALSGLQEEVIAMTPVLLYMTHKLGYNAYVAVAVSFGSAILGASFSPINPFAVVIAQQEAELEFLSGSGYRLVVMGIAFLVWMFLIIRYANRNRVEKTVEEQRVNSSISVRSTIILGLVVLAFAILIIGMLQWDWGFNEMTAEFFVLGILVGLIGRLGINGTSEAYIEGFKIMIFAAMIVGFASSITIILEKGMILDSLIYGLFTPMEHLPKGLAAVAMLISQALLHFPVPSYSGQAILTMPILGPLSDLIGLSRQVCVLAYQYGAVMMDLLSPTNGALMAIIAIAGIPFDKWFRFALKFTLVILGVGALAVIVAIYTGL
jgi:uncharacterized ion transporter superfamily protein YfcC